MRFNFRAIAIVVVAMAMFSAGATRGDDTKLPPDFFDLTGQAGLPVYLKCNQATRGGVDGLHDGEIKTISTDYFNKDFVLDVVFETGTPAEERNEGAVGIGENGHEGGWLLNSVECKFEGRENDTAGEIVFHHKSENSKLGRLKTEGAHLLRMEKAGNALVFKFEDKYAGEDPDKLKFTSTHAVADFKSTTPFLNRLNSAIYLCGNLRWRAIRLQSEGKTVDPGHRADWGVEAVGDAIPFYVFNSGSHVPSMLVKTPSREAGVTKFTDEGWVLSDTYHTRLADYLKKDFTLDLVIHFDPSDRGPMIVGLGENGRNDGNWILNSVCSRIFGPTEQGRLTCTFHNFDYEEPMFGKLGPDHIGPNLIRMQRRGDTLTFAACADFKDKFEPDFMTVLPSLRTQAPYLTAKNGYLFFGEHGVVEKFRLIVDGALIDPGAVSGSARPQLTDGKTSKTHIDVPQDQDARLAVNSEKHRLTPGLGKGLLLLEEDQLRRLGADGFTVVDTLKLPGSYQWIGERRNYFVAMSDQTRSLDLIDKKTLKITRSIQMDYSKRWDLCLNPLKPTSYVTVEKASGDGFINMILIVDETNGDVTEPENFIGKYVKISPDGRTLYSAFNTVYKKGDQLLFNPDQIDIIPEYGDIDILISYNISGGNPRPMAAKNEAGANCQGLALSPDGRLVSFLSFVGYPLYSNNIAAWDSSDFGKRPIAYPTKANKADCKHLAFHPTLPIVAAAAEDGAICFDRQTGTVQHDRLKLPGAFDGIKVNDLIFSPDSSNLILDCDQNGDHYLLRVKINLSPAEAITAKKEIVIPPPPPVPSGHQNGVKT